LRAPSWPRWSPTRGCRGWKRDSRVSSFGRSSGPLRLIIPNRLGLRELKKTAFAVIPILAFLVFAFVPAAYAAKQSQIVLSCSSAPPEAYGHPAHPCAFDNIAFPYVVAGFWIWCQSPQSGTPYGPDCTGSVYYANVLTGVYTSRSISGDASGYPTITFTSSNGVISCSLTITSPSTLSGTCNGDSINFYNVLIRVT
jgi:hypothetical protein